MLSRYAAQQCTPSSCARRRLATIALGRYAGLSTAPWCRSAAGIGAVCQLRTCSSAANADGTANCGESTGRASRNTTADQGTPAVNPRAEDLYERLGVPRDAPRKQIKSAWKQYKSGLHNQGGPADPAAPRGAEYWRMKEAYHVLSDASARAVYDKGGSAYEASHAKYHNGFMKVHNHQGQDFVGVAVVLWFLYMSYQWSRSEALLENYVTFFAMLAIVGGLRQLTAVVVLMSLYTPAGWAQVQKVTGKA